MKRRSKNAGNFLKNFIKKHIKTSSQKKLWGVQVFLVRFILLAAPLYAVLLLGVDLSIFQYQVAGDVVAFSNFFGLSVKQNGVFVTLSSPEMIYRVLISADCTGWKSMLAFFALVFAPVGMSMDKRLYGLLLGIPVIYFANVLRISFIIWSATVYDVATVEFLHIFLWRFGLTIVIFVLWVIWLKTFPKA